MGENAVGSNAQSLTTYHGKILRLNTDGSAPADNPYIANANEKTKRIWAYGLRNPYTLSVQPGTGRIFVNDVGQNTWEEINDATTGGKNFGWPTAEGNSTNPAFTNPVYAYNQNLGGCAITGGTFFNPTTTTYPDSLIGRYFFLDFCGNWMDALKLTVNPATAFRFGTAIAGSPVNMATGPDGNLYFLSRSSAGLFKVTYTPPTPPVITQQPTNQSVVVGGTVSFSVTATGSAPLQYQWQKGNVNITGANSSTFTISDAKPQNAGTYSVLVSYGPGTTSLKSKYVSLSVTQPIPNQGLNPVADAYVQSGSSANTNFGTAATLVTKKTPDVAWQRETLIRFDISNFSGSPGSAKLRLYGGLSDNNNTAIQVEVHDVPTNTWTETGVNWNNRPTETATVYATQTVTGTAKK